MASVNTDTALELVKIRLNRLPTDTSLDTYLAARISAAIQETEAIGITLDGGYDALLYVVDYTVWAYQNRDSQTGMPEWLRLRRRELWLRTAAAAAGGGGE